MRDFEELELDALGSQNLEDYEEMEDFEELEDYEEMEDFEELEDYEELEDFEELESAEADPFIGAALRRARRALPGVLSNPLLKRMARTGAGALGQAIGGKQGGALASMLANQVLREASLEGDFEGDFEEESDFESDFEASGGDLEVLYEMQYYADRAARAESQDEVDQFIPVIAGLASSLLPKAMPLIGKGIGAIGRLFGGRRRSRPLIRTLPRVAAQTATRLARQRATPGRVINTMSRSLGQSLASPQRAAAAMRRPGYARRRGIAPRLGYGRRPGYAPRPGMAPRLGYAPRAGYGQPASLAPRPGFGLGTGYGRRPGSRRRILAPVYAVVRM
jgi:hypothetical protein